MKSRSYSVPTGTDFATFCATLNEPLCTTMLGASVMAPGYAIISRNGDAVGSVQYDNGRAVVSVANRHGHVLDEIDAFVQERYKS